MSAIQQPDENDQLRRIYILVQQRQPMPTHLSAQQRAWWDQAEREFAKTSAAGLSSPLPADSHDPDHGDNGAGGAGTSAPPAQAALSADFALQQAEEGGLALSDDVRERVRRIVGERINE